MDKYLILLKHYYQKIILIIIVILFILLYFFNFTNQNTKNNTTIQTKDENTELENNNESSSTSIDTKIYIEIYGAIKNPGIYDFDTKEVRLFEVIKKSGGYNNANLNCINQVSKVSDSQKIYIPFNNEQCESNTGNNKSDDKININSADSKTLQQLPSVGEKKANDIIEYRDSKNGFTNLEQLKEVKGIGDSTFDKLKDLVSL